MKFSPSQALVYETCPAKYRFGRMHRNGKVSAFSRFSVALHEGVKAHFQMEDGCQRFLAHWDRNKSEPLTYGEGRDFVWYKHLGMKMISLFETSSYAAAQPIISDSRLTVPYNDFDLVTQPDLIVDVDGRETYIELKTTDHPITPAWARLSDQITAGTIAICHHLMTTAPVNAVICNFIVVGPNGGPDVGWLPTHRTRSDMARYAKKLRDIIAQIERGEFPRRGLYARNSPCEWCDHLMTCLADLESPVRQVDAYLDGV